MSIKMNLKETIKTLVLAPAGAGLSYVATNVVTLYAVQMGALTSTVGSSYALGVAGIVFAIILVIGLDTMFASDTSDVKG